MKCQSLKQVFEISSIMKTMIFTYEVQENICKCVFKFLLNKSDISENLIYCSKYIENGTYLVSLNFKVSPFKELKILKRVCS